MRILFSHGYFLSEDPKEKAIMRPYPPLGILYLSAWLEKHGLPNEVFDTTFSEKEKFFENLLSDPPAVLALYSNLMTKRNVIDTLRFVRQTPALRETVVVLGGPDVTYNAENYLDAGAHVIVIGEGEETMREVAETVRAGNRTEFGHVAGVVYRNGEGHLIRTTARAKLRDVDQLPIPAREKIDLGAYLSAWKNKHGQSAVSVSTQRGCPYTCRWCSTAVYGQSYRRRSPESVCDELEHLRAHYDFDTVWFVDDVFTVSHKWLAAFHEELERRQLRVPFECITRADRLNEEAVRLLKACGCFRVWIGAESGSQRIIDAMDRRVAVEQVREMIRAAGRAGIQTGTFIMLGYPGETEADIQETVHHLKSANPDLFTITVAYPIKGTGLYEEVEALRTTHLPWEESTDRDIDFVRTYPRPYYDYAVRWVVNEVHWHKMRLGRQHLGMAGLKTKTKSVLARMGMWYHR
jgi:anaerobic magnesium-protoporphyrin IX monomethyl ester cyclase